MTDLARLVATVQVWPETVSQPLHPVKPDNRAGLAVSVTTALLAYDAEHVDPQLIPAGLDVTVPLPRPVLLTVRVKYWRLNVAVTDLAAVTLTVQAVPDTELQPLHPPKREPLFATAVSVTVVPLVYGSEQSAPQLIPAGLDETVPPPAPALLTASMKLGTVKLAVTVLAALMVTVQAVPEAESHPVHPPKREPPFATAVSVTVVPLV